MINQDWKYLFTSFNGRITRETFWVGLAVLIVVNIGLSLIGAFLGMIFGPLSYLAAIASLATVYPAVALYAKRWHDLSKSGWWTLVALIPVLGAIYVIYMLAIKEGEPASNQYGAAAFDGPVAA
ncbi:DUF805 domain-containing protein [Devosia sp. SL43]|uniref:DUF805 domain-containing protein n=1 Tax=Devosia sp. SL43 TaxID=2806348 RepID=UPI001F3EA936|nr:DUF805 domain-containing protein [Devosia sp. SL43]UJW84890.1 DUF805 domain-containing protein [Devosia sp. SL43]